jgi:dihydroorotase
VAIQGGTIAHLAPAIPSEEARRVLEVPGNVVTPGLIDLHAHVFEGFTRFGANPDIGGVYAGVTTLVDAAARGRQLSKVFRCISCRIVIRKLSRL